MTHLNMFDTYKNPPTDAEKLDYIYRTLKRQQRVKLYIWTFTVVSLFYGYYMLLNSMNGQATLRSLIAPQMGDLQGRGR